MKNKKLVMSSTLFIILLTFSVQAATIWTDKADYAPEETVYISGLDFNPFSVINIQVTRPDGSVHICPDSYWCPNPLPTLGLFSNYPYVLDGIEGTYVIDANDGVNYAQVSFTDAICNWDVACSNDAPCYDRCGDGKYWYYGSGYCSWFYCSDHCRYDYRRCEKDCGAACEQASDCTNTWRCDGETYQTRSASCSSSCSCSYGSWNDGTCSQSVSNCGAECDSDSDCGAGNKCVGCECYTCTTLLDDNFEDGLSKWTTIWDLSTSYSTSPTHSVEGSDDDDDLTSNNLNTAGASFIDISFRYRVDDIGDSDDVYAQYYDGTNYDNIYEIGDEDEDEWHTFSDNINNAGGNAQYFISNFRIKVEGSSIDSGEHLWVDDVLVKKCSPSAADNPEITIVAHKIVCDTEDDLPDWEGTGQVITSTTAQNFVNANPDCHLESNWNFQWAFDEANPGNNLDCVIDPDWTTFGPSDGSGQASVVISDANSGTIWFRECLKNGYLHFSDDTSNDITAEFYCDGDVLNYDNFDYIDDPIIDGETYYCVAFNALAQVCGNNIREGTEECDPGTDNPNDCCSASCMYESNSYTCRADAGDCDVAEHCSGTSASCQANVFEPLGTDCGVCAECSGSGSCVYDDTQDSDCDSSDLSGIATCDNNPDSIHSTWDGRQAFDSQCSGLNSCSQGVSTITHTCADNELQDSVPLGGCDAQCDENTDCANTECDNLDRCYGGEYLDYHDVPNTCSGGCSCTSNTCDDYDATEPDSDNDGYDDPCDNCPNNRNPQQEDADTDGVGDVCDQCPDSRANELIDQNGCDPFQFCWSIKPGQACFHADFIGIDEGSFPHDCTIVVVHHGGFPQELKCYPTTCCD